MKYPLPNETLFINNKICFVLGMWAIAAFKAD